MPPRASLLSNLVRSPGAAPSALDRRRGFTLLEIVIAVTILASFLLPMLLILSRSKVRTIKITQQRELRDLAQRRLFDRIYYDEEESGDFAAEGRPEWLWTIPAPELVGSGEQVLLEYRIEIRTPQKIEGTTEDGESTASSTSTAASRLRSRELIRDDGEYSVYEMVVWTFPDEQWYYEQEELYLQGQYSPLHGDPNLMR